MNKSLVVITGHSKGLGKALMHHYLSLDHYEVIGISRSTLDVESPKLRQVSLDLSDLDILKNELEEVFPKEDYQEIILINNAGWIGEIKPIGNMHPREMRIQVNVNLLAPMYLTNAFIKAYKNHPSRKLVCNISSGAATRPVAGWGGYCSTKAALAMFTMVANKESGSSDFRFFSLAPGIVDTEMQAEIREAAETDFPELKKFLEFKEQGELVNPEDVAKKIEYLLSNPDQFPEVSQDVRHYEIS
ncbi:SDR family NAD(P)-dependent oxidoreductase [Algoriphagus kandeliae]|uniref:SDR family NAD(P)-dependent oxidoreductase n=1 Tax=Algoriphagus kandeliae TaxID=2562278 RepID=A0A4Y9QLA9_9BACT|nr:SDR family NAD(P)-dependent oxidoreductase [Algoriphagus kandeliae]TFV93040.1 SDR family NAD(P)-dependent oxidoreductase [Algoriphagus kandeliae]